MEKEEAEKVINNKSLKGKVSKKQDVSKKQSTTKKISASKKQEDVKKQTTSKKKSTSKKKTSSKKQNIFIRIVDFFKTNYKITLISSISVALLITIIISATVFLRISSLNKVVLTINDMEYTKSDFMIYFYSVKYDYFGKDVDNITDDNMNIIVSEEENTTLGEYLKNKTLGEVKTAAAILDFASKNNVELNDKDYEELKKDKQKYIKSIGGNMKFKKMLKSNDTTEKSYDKMAETDKLYNKIIKKLYSEGKRNDLTEDEISQANENYKSQYFKIEQVILTTIDIETKKSLSDTVINQKKTLADTIYDLACNGEDFDKLVSKYSEASVDKEPPYYEYYEKGKLLTDLEDAIVELGDNEVSNVIQTNYAFHIVKKLELDDSKFSEYLDELREEKALKDLNSSLDSLKIIYRDAYKNIKY